MKRLILGFYFTLFCSAWASVAEAGLVEHRTFEGNSDGVIYIDDLNQEWINLDLTVGLSMDDALAQYSAQGFYAPDITHVTAMLRALGIADNPDICYGIVSAALCTHDTVNGAPLNYSDPLFDWFNRTEGNNSSSTIFASYSSAMSTRPASEVLYLFADTDGGNDGDLIMASGFFSSGLAFGTQANFLVRDVSEPRGIFLILLCLTLSSWLTKHNAPLRRQS